MICFENNREYILRPAEYAQFSDYVTPTLGEDENILSVCQTVQDGIIFTDRRVIAVDIQGMLGTQADVCSLPYRSVRSFAFDIEELSSVMDLFFSGQKMVRFRFDFPDMDISMLATVISRFTLNQQT